MLYLFHPFQRYFCSIHYTNDVDLICKLINLLECTFPTISFPPSLVQLSKSNLHALAPAQVGVDPRIVHKQVDTIHLQSYLDPFQLSSSGEFNHWPWNGIWMVQTLKYASHSSKSLGTFKCRLKNWEKIEEKKLNNTYFENCSCLVTSHWTNVTLIFENVSRIFGTFVSMSSPNLLLAKLFPQLLQGGKPSLLPHVRDTHPEDEIDVQQTWNLSKILHCRIFRKKFYIVNFT